MFIISFSLDYDNIHFCDHDNMSSPSESVSANRYFTSTGGLTNAGIRRLVRNWTLAILELKRGAD